jgi:NADPH:quinone reductase-like Zn-dependent oxidoreductase
MERMRAVVQRQYGGPDVLQVEQIPKPTPREGEVRIRVRATTADCWVRTGGPAWGKLVLGLRQPRRPVIGIELAGDIEACGRSVRHFREGDPVYAFTGFALGAYAEYVCLPEGSSVERKPANTSYEEAAALVDGATTALFFLRDRARLQPGQRVMIYGASGSVGTYAVQLAKLLGAHVIGVCSSANAEAVRALGADEVVDYTRQDFAALPEPCDVVFDAIGKSTFSRCRRALTPRGLYLSTTLGATILLQSLWTRLGRGRRAGWGLSIEKREDLRFVRELVERGELSPILDRRYPLEQIAEAHRYVDTGRKRGNVVITV